MAEVNHSPTWLRSPSAGGCPIAVYAAVEFPSVQSRPPTARVVDLRSIAPLSQGLERPSQRSDGQPPATCVFTPLLGAKRFP
jgi:hypothetical protein